MDFEPYFHCFLKLLDTILARFYAGSLFSPFPKHLPPAPSHCRQVFAINGLKLNQCTTSMQSGVDLLYEAVEWVGGSNLTKFGLLRTNQASN